MTTVEAVPADASGLSVLGHADRLRPAETPHLLAYLATVTDPRTRTGRPLAIGVLGRAGPVNLAAALRHHARGPWPPSEYPRTNRTLQENAGALDPDLTWP